MVSDVPNSLVMSSGRDEVVTLIPCLIVLYGVLAGDATGVDTKVPGASETVVNTFESGSFGCVTDSVLVSEADAIKHGKSN